MKKLVSLLTKNFSLVNCITLVRIAGAIALIFLTPFTPWYFAVYTIAGVSDAIDGTVARVTGKASAFGARLDSVADLLFYTVMMVRLWPYLWVILPKTIWYLVALALLLRLSSYVTAAIRFKRFASLHTYLNKLTGAGVFLLPYYLRLPCGIVLSFIVASIGVVASAEEWMLHLFCRSYKENSHSLLALFRRRRVRT